MLSPNEKPVMEGGSSWPKGVVSWKVGLGAGPPFDEIGCETASLSVGAKDGVKEGSQSKKPGAEAEGDMVKSDSSTATG